MPIARILNGWSSKSYQMGVLDSAGSIQTFGENSAGSLGTGNTNNTGVPIIVTIPGKTIAGYEIGSHSIVVCTDGTLYVTGNNDNGQLGLNDTTNRASFAQVTLSGSKLAICAAIGGNHTAVVCSDGTVQTFGRNYYGQLGNGTSTNSLVPVQITLSGGKKAVQVACGYNHTVILCNDGTIQVFGRNHQGQLGNGTTSMTTVAPITEQLTLNRTPLIITLSGSKLAKYIYCGGNHTVVYCTDNTVQTFGCNFMAQLARNYSLITRATSTNKIASPVSGFGEYGPYSMGGTFDNIISVKITGTAQSTAYSAIDFHLMNASGAIVRTVSVFPNNYGTNTAEYSLTDEPISSITQYKLGFWWNSGRAVSLFLTTASGTFTAFRSPAQIDTIPSTRTISYLGVGYEHMVIIDVSGGIYSIGNQRRGQLGNGQATIATTPSVPASTYQTITLANAKIPRAAACSVDNSLVICTDGTVQTCGFNDFGTNGNNSLAATNITTFQAITLSSGRTAITAIDSVPDPPTLISATPSNSQVSVTWIENINASSPITYYVISRTGLADISLNSFLGTTYLNTDLTNGTSYTFSVRSGNVVGLSALSNTIVVIPFTVPSSPTLIATADNTQVLLSWNTPSNNGSAITYYIISCTGFADISRNVNLGTSYTYTGLTNGTSYSFTIRAGNVAGSSSPSNTQVIKPFTVPDTPTLLSATSNNQSVNLLWTTPNNNGEIITSYYINIIRNTINTLNTTERIHGYNIYGYYYAYQQNGNDLSLYYDYYGGNAYSYELYSGQGLYIRLGLPVMGDWSDNLIFGIQDDPLILSYNNGWQGNIVRYYTGEFIGTYSEGQTLTIYLIDNYQKVYLDGTFLFSFYVPNSAINNYSLFIYPSFYGFGIQYYGSYYTLYNIYFGNSYSAFPTDISLNAISYPNSYTVPNLINNENYSFAIKATNIAGDSGYSTTLTATPVQALPDAPILLACIPGDGKIDVRWSDPTFTGLSSITSYEINYTNLTNNIALYTFVSAPASNYVLTVTNGNTYRVSVQAINSYGTSLDSNYKDIVPNKTAYGYTNISSNIYQVNVTNQIYYTIYINNLLPADTKTYTLTGFDIYVAPSTNNSTLVNLSYYDGTNSNNILSEWVTSGGYQLRHFDLPHPTQLARDTGNFIQYQVTALDAYSTFDVGLATASNTPDSLATVLYLNSTASYTFTESVNNTIGSSYRITTNYTNSDISYNWYTYSDSNKSNPSLVSTDPSGLFISVDYQGKYVGATIYYNTSLATDISSYNSTLTLVQTKYNPENFDYKIVLNSGLTNKMNLFNTATVTGTGNNISNVNLVINQTQFLSILTTNKTGISQSNNSRFLGFDRNNTPFGTRLLEIMATKVFGHAKARAAIANDAEFYNMNTIIPRIQNSFNVEKNNIAQYYMNATGTILNGNTSNLPVSNANFIIPVYLVGNTRSLFTKDIIIADCASAGGSLIKNGVYNIPLLFHIT